MRNIFYENFKFSKLKKKNKELKFKTFTKWMFSNVLSYWHLFDINY